MNDEQNDNGPEIEKKERNRKTSLSRYSFSLTSGARRGRNQGSAPHHSLRRSGAAGWRSRRRRGRGRRAGHRRCRRLLRRRGCRRGRRGLAPRGASFGASTGGRIRLFSKLSLFLSLSLSLSLDETLPDTSVLLFSSLEEKEGGQKRQRQAERWVGEEREKALTTMTPSATEKNEKKTPSVFYTLSNLSLSLSHRCIPSISSSRFSCSFPSASACLIAWVEAAEESPVPFPSPPPPPPSSSAFSDSSLCSHELGPDRRGELRARRTVSAPSSGSPRGHSEESPVQVERLGAQQKVLEVEGSGSRSRRARRHRGRGGALD